MIVVTFKDELNPVTDVDQAAETLIRQGIHTHFPTHAIQGEEQGETRSEGGAPLIVDPLDGTANYAHSFPILPSALRWRMRMESRSVWSMILCAMSCSPPSAGNQPGSMAGVWV